MTQEFLGWGTYCLYWYNTTCFTNSLFTCQKVRLPWVTYLLPPQQKFFHLCQIVSPIGLVNQKFGITDITLKLQVDSSGLFNKVNNMNSNPRKFVGIIQFLSETLFTLMSKAFLDFGNTSIWFWWCNQTWTNHKQRREGFQARSDLQPDHRETVTQQFGYVIKTKHWCC